MISKNKLKYIHSLEQKKARQREGVFVAEGTKTVNELLLADFCPQCLIGTEAWFDSMPESPARKAEHIIVTEDELRKASFLQHPQQVMGIFLAPQSESLPAPEWFDSNLCLVLDGVQDPGNLGTIIRIADWFGISTIICSRETADAFAPKVVQATMGSIARVRVVYTSLPHLVDRLPKDHPVFGTLLDGENIYAKELPQHGIIVMGNEGNGISAEMRSRISQKLLIPTFATTADKADSLNVAVATAIVCSEFRRSKGKKVKG